MQQTLCTSIAAACCEPAVLSVQIHIFAEIANIFSRLKSKLVLYDIILPIMYIYSLKRSDSFKNRMKLSRINV